MSKRIMSYLLIVCIVVGIGLLLFKESNKDFARSERETASLSPASEERDGETDFSVQIPDSWKEEIGSNNRIDAAITVPESIRREGFRSADAEIKTLDREKILSLLEEDYRPRKTTENENLTQYTGTGGMFLNFDKYGNADMVTDFYLYFAMSYCDQQVLERYNRDLYPVDQDFENFTVAECDDIIAAFCESAGIEGDISMVHRVIDYRIMKEEALELHPDGTENRPDYPWSADDNSYYCQFSQTCNGLSILPIFYLQANADILNASGHSCLVNRRKLCAFNLSEIYSIRYRESYENLMEFSEILEKYRQYMSMEPQVYETMITDITMRAIAVSQGNGEYRITPVWIFYGCQKVAEDDSDPYYQAIVIMDAVTGERL